MTAALAFSVPWLSWLDCPSQCPWLVLAGRIWGHLFLVSYKGHVLCGLCSPVGIRMKRVACWAWYTLWKPIWPLVCASCCHPRNTLAPAEEISLVHSGWPGYMPETESPSATPNRCMREQDVPPSFQILVFVEKSGMGLIVELGCVFCLTRGRLICPYVACMWSLCQSKVVSQRSAVVKSYVLTSETPEQRAKVIQDSNPA